MSLPAGSFSTSTIRISQPSTGRVDVRRALDRGRAADQRLDLDVLDQRLRRRLPEHPRRPRHRAPVVGRVVLARPAVVMLVGDARRLPQRQRVVGDVVVQVDQARVDDRAACRSAARWRTRSARDRPPRRPPPGGRRRRRRRRRGRAPGAWRRRSRPLPRRTSAISAAPPALVALAATASGGPRPARGRATSACARRRATGARPSSAPLARLRPAPRRRRPGTPAPRTADRAAGSPRSRSRRTPSRSSAPPLSPSASGVTIARNSLTAARHSSSSVCASGLEGCGTSRTGRRGARTTARPRAAP